MNRIPKKQKKDIEMEIDFRCPKLYHQTFEYGAEQQSSEMTTTAEKSELTKMAEKPKIAENCRKWPKSRKLLRIAENS